MSYTLCCKSLRMSRCIVSHGLQKARDRLLVEWSDSSELLNNSSLRCIQTFAQCFLPSKHINNVHSQPSDSPQVGCIRVSSATFIAALGIAVHRPRLSQILLIKTQPDSFVA